MNLIGYFAQHYTAILNIAGACFEVAGVCFVGNRFVMNSPRWQLIFVLLSSFWRGKVAKNAAGFSDFSQEDALTTLQGLAFIAFGFILISIPKFIQLF